MSSKKKTWSADLSPKTNMNNFPNSSEDRRSKETHRRTYNTRQLAECLGVSRDTIRNMRDDGELPPVIPTKRRIVRWTVDDIDLWFELDCPREKDFVHFKGDLKQFTRRQRAK